MFIIPTGPVPFQYSGQRTYDDKPERYSKMLKKSLKDNKELKFRLDCDGIDTSIYKDEWKNFSIGCEVVNASVYPWSLNLESDSITK